MKKTSKILDKLKPQFAHMVAHPELYEDRYNELYQSIQEILPRPHIRSVLSIKPDNTPIIPS